MTWSPSDIVNLCLGIAAIMVAGASALYARRQATEARRANDLNESMRTEQRLANRVRWKLVSVSVDSAGGGNFALTHTGSEPAEDVRAWTESRSLLSGPLEETPQGLVVAAEIVEPNAALRFTCTGPSAYHGFGNELQVTWKGQEKPVAVPFPGGLSLS